MDSARTSVALFGFGVLAELREGFGQDPGDVHLRHAKLLCDLGLCHRFEESHGQYETFPFG